MKILIVSSYISTSKSLEFYQSQQINLAKELVKLNVEVGIVTANRFINKRDTKTLNGIKIDYLKTSKFFPEKKFNQPLLIGLWAYLRKSHFDIIQTSEFHNISTLIVSFFCYIFNKKMILYQGMYKDSDVSFKKFLFQVWDFLFGSLIVNATTLAICKTSESANYLNQKGIKNTKVIPVGVNISMFNSLNSNTKQNISSFKLLMIGSLIERKNYIKTIEALGLVKQSGYNFHLTIIGKGEMEYLIKEKIKTLKLKNNISLINAVPNNKMKHFYTDADFTMMFSYDEIFGMTILEAMACGCPFISNFEPGPKDIIDSTNGYKIHSNDPHKLAKDLISIFNKAKLDRHKIEETTKTNYSWQSIAKCYLKLYNQLKNKI